MNDTQTITTLAELLARASAFVAEHPDLPAPYITAGGRSDGGGYVDLDWFLELRSDDHDAQKRAAAEIIRAIGGKWNKVNWGPNDDKFRFRQDIDGLSLDVQVEREAVCERVVTGVETVTVPAVEAKPERTEEREVVEWRCEPLLTEATS